MPKLGKRGALPLSDVLGIIALMVLFAGLGIFLNIAGLLDTKGPKINARVQEVLSSRACDIDLVNFLRAESGQGLTFAEMFAAVGRNPAYVSVLKTSATKFMEQNYRREDNKKSLWRLAAKYPNVETPVVEPFGPLQTVSATDTCKKIISTLRPDIPLEVELSLEY